MEAFKIALTFFLVANPIGNSPAILAVVKDFPFERQRAILFREALIALALAIFFQFFGEAFLSGLNIDRYTVSLCGGVMLFIVSLSMIFPTPADTEHHSLQEPMIVPIATPLITGPGLLSIIMVKSKEAENFMLISSAILIAWIGVTFVLTTAPYLQKFLGRRGMIALEQFMGMILSMISMEMIVNGSALFVKTLQG